MARSSRWATWQAAVLSFSVVQVHTAEYGAEVKSKFQITEGNVPFRYPEDATSNDGLGWKDDYDDDAELGGTADYADDYDYMDYYYEDYYMQFADAIAGNQASLVLGGEVTESFVCRGNDQLAALMIEPLFVDTRRLHMTVAYYYAQHGSFLGRFGGFMRDYDAYYYYNQGGDDGFGGDGDGSFTHDGNYAVSFELKAIKSYDIAENLEPLPDILQESKAKMWRSPSQLVTVTKPAAHPLHAQGEDVETGLALEYECKGTGQALVELWLTVRGKDKPPEDICMNWIKHCNLVLPFFGVEDEDFNDMMVNSKAVKDAPFLKNPAADPFNFFYIRMMTNGLLRMRLPDIFVENNDVGSVDARFEDMENSFMEITRDRSRITVDYRCTKVGMMDVFMLLQRDWWSDTEVLEFKWQKKCDGPDGTKLHSGLQAFVASSTYNNKTKVLDNGAALPGFKRPCPRAGAARVRHTGAHHGNKKATQAPPPNCANEVPGLVVPRRDEETLIRWNWAGPDAFPHFDESIVGYNPRLMEVKIESEWGDRKSTVSYLCFGDGIGNVTVTFYSQGHPPMDFAWRKRCTEPASPHSSRFVLTAPQVISFFVVSIALCGILIFMCCYFRNMNNDRDKVNASEAEVANLFGAASDMSGTGFGNEKESITYHA